MAQRPRVLTMAATIVLLGLVVGCSKGTASSTPAPTAAPATTSAAVTEPGLGTDPPGGDQGSGEGRPADGSSSADGGTGPDGGATQIGLTRTDAEQLRMIYVDQGVSVDAADCIVATTVSALEGATVTQDSLVAALSDAVTDCGAASAAGSDIVGSIIDNYPSGGAPVSTTIVPGGGGGSPVDNFPSGG